MTIDGQWDVVVASPLGQQKSVLTLVTDGETLTGTDVGSTGTLELKDGKVSGNNISWKSDITTPMKMQIESEATIDGDKIEGFAKAGVFGKFKLTGTKRA